MAKWYYRTAEGEVGPLRPSELREHVAAGKIQPQTLIRKGDSHWVEAAQVGGLFEAAARGGSHFQCPFCGHEIDPPPTRCAHCGRPVETAYQRGPTETGREEDPAVIAARRAEERNRRRRRRDIAAHASLLVMLIGTAAAAPWLYRAADQDQLPLHRHAVTGILISVVVALLGAALLLMRNRD